MHKTLRKLLKWENKALVLESKNESRGPRRVSKAIVSLSKDTEKTLRRERGPDRVTTEGF